MKRSTVILITTGVLLVIGLCIANVYISLSMPNNKKLNAMIDKKIANRVQEEVASIPTPRDGLNGIDGRDGVTTIIEKHVATQYPLQSGKPKDGRDGVDGQNGTDGKNGRTPIFDVDTETGDILVKYEGDTLWSLLVEGCKLTKDCEE